MSLNENKKIIEYLCNNVGWFIASESTDASDCFLKDKPFDGFCYHTHNATREKMLNEFALKIIQKTCNKLNVEYKVERVMWNMYLKGQEGKTHTDKDQDGFLSILYNLHTTDGGTVVDGVFYKDKAFETKVFYSNRPHRGIGPKKDLVRFNLNVLIQVL